MTKISEKFEKLELHWKVPIRLEKCPCGKENCKNINRLRKRIMISHDESCFKSGEMRKKRWRYGNNLPL